MRLADANNQIAPLRSKHDRGIPTSTISQSKAHQPQELGHRGAAAELLDAVHNACSIRTSTRAARTRAAGFASCECRPPTRQENKAR